MTIIERILEIAEQKNIKQVEIANLLNKGTSQITSWKQRGCNPPAEYIPAIAELLNVSINYLMTGAEENENALTQDERELLENFRSISKSEQKELLMMAKYKKEYK